MKDLWDSIIESLKWSIPTDKFYISDLIQIIIIFFVLYYVIRNLRNTRGWVIVKGVLVLFLIYGIVFLNSLSVVQYLMERLFSIFTLALVIMFQPELRKLIESLGNKKNIEQFRRKFKKGKQPNLLFDKKTIDEIVIACSEMSKAKTGALIVFERDIPLVDYINSGIKVDANITNQLLINTFEKNTPLHDGAVIIKNNKLDSATCYLPLSDNSNIDKALGTRHRAGIGITENTDAFVIIVSEETGNISWCEDGKVVHDVSSLELASKLKEVAGSSKNTNKKKHKSRPIATIFTQIGIAIISVFVWAMVLNVNDQVMTMEIKDVPVVIQNEDVLNEVGQTYEIQEGQTIDVVVKGRRSDVENLTKDDVLAVADFRKLSVVYSIPIEVSLKNEDDSLVEISIKDNDTMILSLEELVEVEVPIEVKTTGVTTDGYYVKINGTTPTVCKVIGSQSKVNTLDKAVVTVDVTNKNTNFVSSVVPVLYDKNGTLLSNDDFIFKDENIKVSASVFETKDVPINVHLENNEDSSYYYELIGFESDNKTVQVAANNDILEQLEYIDIPIELTDNNELATSIIINLNNYLDEDVYLSNSQEEQIQLTLNFNKYIKKNISLDSSNIKTNFVNKNEKYNYELTDVPTNIVALINTDIIKEDEVTLELLNPSIKIEETEIGEYKTELKLTNIDGVLYTGSLNVTYKITSDKGE